MTFGISFCLQQLERNGTALLASDQKIRQELCSSSSFWHLTFAFGRIGKRIYGRTTDLSAFYQKWINNVIIINIIMIIAIFFIDILCWAPWISQVQDTGLPSIILITQPWLYAHVHTVHLLLWGTIIWKKKHTNEHTNKEKQKKQKSDMYTNRKTWQKF